MLKLFNKNPFKSLNKSEFLFWIMSILIILTISIFVNNFTFLTLVSCIGATSLLFVAKGNIYGPLLGILFSLAYAITSFEFHYYGEVITYLFMSAPMSILSLVSWLKNPYKDSTEVTVNSINKKQLTVIFIANIFVTIIFYFILKKLYTPNMFFSTLSVFTSFLAVCLTFLRSPYYALAYVLNDFILIVLWVHASITDLKYINMVICFIIFIISDCYGYICWQKMKYRQKSIN